jgi:hypothetical protein
MASRPGVAHRELGKTLDGRALDLLSLGEGPKQVWFYARQHPGESMAEWWMEGALEKLTDPTDAATRTLRERATFAPGPEHEPGRQLSRPSADQCRRREPQSGMACADRWSEARRFCWSAMPWTSVASISRSTCMATKRSPPTSSPVSTVSRHGRRRRGTSSGLCPPPCRGDPAISDRERLSEGRAGPGEPVDVDQSTRRAIRCGRDDAGDAFKDHDPSPDVEYGWSPDRCKALAHACIETLADMIDAI